MNLFAIPVHVSRLEGAKMPSDLKGAYLVCYVTAPDHLEALRLVVEELTTDHYQFLELNGKISQLDPHLWSSYVDATWPNEKQALPDQQEMLAALERPTVFYGPFCGYERNPKIREQGIRYVSHEEAMRVGNEIFEKHAELFRRLAE